MFCYPHSLKNLEQLSDFPKNTNFFFCDYETEQLLIHTIIDIVLLIYGT